MSSSAKATYVEGTKQTAIHIVIDSMPVVLARGDCIEFRRVVKTGENPVTVAKILGFSYNGKGYVDRIFYLPWRVNEKKWGSSAFPQRQIGLERPYSGGDDGDWTTIVKLAACPDAVVGGRKKNSTRKKTARRNRRLSRRN